MITFRIIWIPPYIAEGLSVALSEASLTHGRGYRMAGVKR